MPVLGGAAHRFADVHANDGIFSPDGKHIMYAIGPDLFQANLDGTESRKLLAISDVVLFPRFSPDGGVLRFTVHDFETASLSIWEAHSDGTELHPILPDWNKPHHECCGAWTPDGRYYIFESVRAGTTTSNLWALREKGQVGKRNREPVQLTAGPLDFHMPVPSPDDRKLYAIGVQQRGELVRYDAKSRQFQSFLSAIWAEQLDFSRDGRWVAYVLYPEGSLWRSNFDGSERLQLTFPPVQATSPRWSPDGKRIVFSTRTPGKPSKIYSVVADGGAPEQLTTGERPDSAPCWSVDGNSLVFGESTASEGTAVVAIRTLDLKTRQVSVLPGSEGLLRPGCSPDGRHISALTADSQAIMLFNGATQTWSELARAIANSPAWSHDSQYVYFDSYQTKDAAILRVRISDHRVERVSNLEGFRRAESATLAWPWMGLAPDDSPLLVRDVGTQEIYALDWEAP